MVGDGGGSRSLYFPPVTTSCGGPAQTFVIKRAGWVGTIYKMVGTIYKMAGTIYENGWNYL